MDITGADFYRVVDMIKTRLNANPVPIQLPIGSEDTFAGIVDLVTMRAVIYTDDLGTTSEDAEIPAELKDKADEFRLHMVEALAMTRRAFG